MAAELAVEDMAVEDMAAKVMARAAEDMAVEGSMGMEGMAVDKDPAKDTVVKKCSILKM